MCRGGQGEAAGEAEADDADVRTLATDAVDEAAEVAHYAARLRPEGCAELRADTAVGLRAAV